MTAAGLAESATRPRYGGRLRVEMQAVVRRLDPSERPADPAEAAAKEKLETLVFERLVRLDENGRAQPALSLSWDRDAAGKSWGFRLRAGVKFHDGTPLTPDKVVASLRPGGAWLASPGEDAVVIQSDLPEPDLLLDLAHPRQSILLRRDDGTLWGTGPFRPAGSEAGRSLVLTANEDYWGGRPFLDRITIEMGRAPRDQMLDLELGKAEFIEISPADSRTVEQRGMKMWSSAARELIALIFERGRPVIEDLRVRQAIALSIDCAAIHNVRLQRQGEIAGGLLPGWLSGYAFLFSKVYDPNRARQLVSSMEHPVAALALGYDASDPLARAIAERIAVNAREAGIMLQVSPAPAPSDMRLVRIRLGSLHPAAALGDLAAFFHLAESVNLLPRPTHEALYHAERALLEDFRVIPLFHLPELYALSPRVKTWTQPGVFKNGEWNFEDVWLDVEKP
jgi:peptide/nickel transport system substrate-binding protein